MFQGAVSQLTYSHTNMLADVIHNAPFNGTVEYMSVVVLDSVIVILGT